MHGEPIEFEFSSANATTAAELTLRTAGSVTARALAADERVILQAGHAYAAAGATLVTIFSDADNDNAVDAGERMAVFGDGHTSFDFCGTGGGISGAKGIVPHVIASGAAQVSITGVGVIIKG